MTGKCEGFPRKTLISKVYILNYINLNNFYHSTLSATSPAPAPHGGGGQHRSHDKNRRRSDSLTPV
jgi:hypothetical protein